MQDFFSHFYEARGNSFPPTHVGCGMSIGMSHLQSFDLASHIAVD